MGGTANPLPTASECVKANTTMKSSARYVSVFVAAILFCEGVSAAPVLFTDRAAWETAVASAGLTSQTENFNSFAQDTIFASPAVITSSLGFTVTNTNGATSPSTVSSNNIVLDGTGSGNLDGTTYLQPDDGSNGPDGNTVFTFSSPIRAFAFDYGSFGDAATEGLAADGSNVFVPVAAQSGTSPRFRFAGFLDTSGSFSVISTTGRDTTYRIDNVAFAAVPEPSSFLFLGCICLGFVGWKRLR